MLFLLVSPEGPNDSIAAQNREGEKRFSQMQLPTTYIDRQVSFAGWAGMLFQLVSPAGLSERKTSPLGSSGPARGTPPPGLFFSFVLSKEGEKGDHISAYLPSIAVLKNHSFESVRLHVSKIWGDNVEYYSYESKNTILNVSGIR